MALRVVRTLPEREWRSFVDEHPQGNIFHTPEMFQVFSRARRHYPSLWAVVSDNGQVHALVLPVQITLSAVLRRFTTRTVVYGSVLYEQHDRGKEAVELLLRSCWGREDGNSLFTELRNLSDLSPVQPILQASGFAYEDHLNYLIDLDRPTEAIFQGIGRRTRKNIRHGLNRGAVAIEEVKDRRQLATCYQLIQQTYREAGVPLADRTLFEAAFDLLYPKGMVRFTLARVGQAPAAVSVELLYKDLVYGWYGGMNRAYGDHVPNELLMWHILKWGAENGYRLYDFGGAGRPNERYGVRDFKAKFGGTLVCFGRNTCVHTPFLMRLAKLGNKLLGRLL